MTTWIDSWRDATVAIGRVYQTRVKRPGGRISKGQIFVVVGTGVIFGSQDDPTNTPWLVTAKHVFLDPAEKWDPASLQIRFSRFDQRPVDEYLGIRIDLKKGGKRRWLSHPEDGVDLVCLPLALAKERAGLAQMSPVTVEDFATAEQIYEGAPVMVLGYPGAVGPGFWSRALVRQGIISWVSPTKPESNVFLIDSNVFPGNSGGPVFKLPAGPDRHGRFAVGGSVAFLGIVSQARMQRLPLIVGGKELEVLLQGRKKPQTLFVPNFISIGVIEPAFRVKQLLSAAAKSVRR